MANVWNSFQWKHLKIFLLFFITIFLVSCKSSKRHDGPPDFYVDENRIPNAIPKPEPLAKYGNMPSYRVFGKRYFTLRSSKHYEAIGTASWYGTMFQARKTSSGEPYNMLSMTAAHKTLPLPTYVEVTNLSNNRKIIVKVNDRGPFESNRLIDLSYVAAKKLGMLGHGTAMVRVKAIDPETYGKPIYFARRNEHSWQKFRPIHINNYPQKAHEMSVYIQVGAFKNKKNALQLKNKLSISVDAPVKISYPSASLKLYRVKIGPFKDIASATIVSNQLKNMKIKTDRLLEA